MTQLFSMTMCVNFVILLAEVAAVAVQWGGHTYLTKEQKNLYEKEFIVLEIVVVIRTFGALCS